MRRIFAAALALILSASPAGAAERRYTVTDFDRIQLDGPYQVTLATGRNSGARAVGSQAAIDRLSVEVQGRTLRIRTSRSAWGGYPGDQSGEVTLEVTIRDLREALVAGSGSLAIDKAKGLRLELTVTGNGRLTAASVDADNLIVGLLGSGRVEIAGKAKQLRATIRGTGDFAGRGLQADDAQISADTAGMVAVGVLRSARVNAIGSGDVSVIGHAACTLTGPAASRVRCGD
jgi:hypothetical protein